MSGCLRWVKMESERRHWCTPVESDKQTVKWHVTGEPRFDEDHKWKDLLKFIYEYRWSQCKEKNKSPLHLWRVAIFSTLVFGEHLFERSFQTGFTSRVRCRLKPPARPPSPQPPTTSIDHSISTEQSTSSSMGTYSKSITGTMAVCVWAVNPGSRSGELSTFTLKWLQFLLILSLWWPKGTVILLSCTHHPRTHLCSNL